MTGQLARFESKDGFVWKKLELFSSPPIYTYILEWLEFANSLRLLRSFSTKNIATCAPFSNSTCLKIGGAFLRLSRRQLSKSLTPAIIRQTGHAVTNVDGDSDRDILSANQRCWMHQQTVASFHSSNVGFCATVGPKKCLQGVQQLYEIFCGILP